MAAADFELPPEINPAIDRSPAAPAVSRNLFITPSNGTSFGPKDDIQFKFPTAQPGSILDPKYTYLKMDIKVTFLRSENGAASPSSQCWKFPSGGASSFFDRMEIFQGGVPMERVDYYNIMAKKFFQDEAGHVDVANWHAGCLQGSNFEQATEGEEYSSYTVSMPTTKYQQMTGHGMTFVCHAPVSATETTVDMNFQFCIPILSGLVGLWSEKYLPLMLMGVDSFYMNLHCSDIYSFLEPIWSSATANGFGERAQLATRGGNGSVIVVPDATKSGTFDAVATDPADYPWTGVWSNGMQPAVPATDMQYGTCPTTFALTKMVLVCRQIMLLPSLTHMLYNNSNLNSVSWTTVSRRDYSQILKGTAGGWFITTSDITGPKLTPAAASTKFDLIVPCKLQSVRCFDLIHQYIGSKPLQTDSSQFQFSRQYHPYDHLFFLNPVYTSLQFKKGSEFFPQRPMTLKKLYVGTVVPGCGPEYTAESLIGSGSWYPFGHKKGHSVMNKELTSGGISPGAVQNGTYTFTQDTRVFRRVDHSTRTGISFEKEQFNVVMSLNPVGGNVAPVRGMTASNMDPLPMSGFRFHFIATYDLTVSITPIGSMEVAY